MSCYVRVYRSNECVTKILLNNELVINYFAKMENRNQLFKTGIHKT